MSENSENDESGDFSAENLALDDPAVRELGNLKVSIADVPEDKLTEREKSRLNTLRKKAGELEAIVRERKTEENQ